MEPENFINHLEEYYTEQGIIPFDTKNKVLNINTKYLCIPESLTEISPYDLGEHLNAFSQQKAYARTLLSRIEIQIEVSKRRYTEAFDSQYIILTNNNKKYSELAKERIINASEEVRYLLYEYSDWKQKAAYIKNYISNIEDTMFLLSREITRRGLDFN